MLGFVVLCLQAVVCICVCCFGVAMFVGLFVVYVLCVLVMFPPVLIVCVLRFCFCAHWFVVCVFLVSCDVCRVCFCVRCCFYVCWFARCMCVAFISGLLVFVYLCFGLLCM